jgi:hypothetical protein
MTGTAALDRTASGSIGKPRAISTAHKKNKLVKTQQPFLATAII